MTSKKAGKGSKGPNDYKKGNRSDSKRETAHLKEIAAYRHDSITEYKQQAELYRKSFKYKQEDLVKIYDNICDYIEDKESNGKPITAAGLILASGISKSTWYEIGNGKYDYKLFEYIDLHDIDIEGIEDTYKGIPYVLDDNNHIVLLIAWSEIVEKSMLLLEEQNENGLYSGKNPVGHIFSLKCISKWREDESPATNQTLVINTTEKQAKDAIQLLTGNKG